MLYCFSNILLMADRCSSIVSQNIDYLIITAMLSRKLHLYCWLIVTAMLSLKWYSHYCLIIAAILFLKYSYYWPIIVALLSQMYWLIIAAILSLKCSYYYLINAAILSRKLHSHYWSVFAAMLSLKYHSSIGITPPAVQVIAGLYTCLLNGVTLYNNCSHLALVHVYVFFCRIFLFLLINIARTFTM